MTLLPRKAALAALSLILAAGAVGGALWLRRPAPETAPPPPASGPADESQSLADSKGLASRSNLALSLAMKSGEIVVLTDHVQCGDLRCPPMLATEYRYQGWDPASAGYRLTVSQGKKAAMVLTWGEEEPVLLDARHVAEPAEPQPLPSPTTAAKTDDSLNDWLADLNSDRDQEEKPQFAAHPGQASRDGAKLSLALTDGRRLELVDDLVCGQLACPPQMSRSFNYLGESPNGRFHVVRQEWNEGEEGLLVDQAGMVQLLPSVPSFSPDGRFAVAVTADLESQASHRLEVWDMQSGKADLVFSVDARAEDDTVFELVGWNDASHLGLKRGAWGSEQRAAVTLVHAAAGWHLEDAGIGN